MRKRLLMIILAVAAACSLAACGGSTGAATDAEKDSTYADQVDADGIYEPNFADKKTMLEAAEATELIRADAGAVGSKVPEFTLRTYDGGTFGTADMRGKVTLLVFFFPT